MKVILISNPTATAEESTLINNLFNEGLAFFHLRKPNASEHEIGALLQQIDEQFYPKIALHQHHQLVSRFNVKRLHYTEHQRKQATIAQLKDQKEKGFILSTSIHQLESLNQITEFDYSFYGPVFNSISKKDYQSVVPLDFKVEKHINTPAIIALGGINDKNIHQIKTMNFDGFALLGFIWEQPKNAIANFKIIQQTLKETYD
ncbi:thiamine-phosphate pyrophosphorylase [Pedobacter sp. UYP30]|uniref:thiamine phosphate synthase n=1 Tax=Pedobacter sp. UYP30 TaxID=1756400 RepID=UPI003390EED7